MKFTLKTMKKLLLYLWMAFGAYAVHAQSEPFQLILEPMQINGFTGVQSFAFGTYENKWVIFGGRLDGLHRRQQSLSFDIPGHNTTIQVVDPQTGQRWSASLNQLSTALKDQLSSTNMEFHQDGNYLYVVGGYGFSAATNTRVTYNKLTAIDLPGLINAIISGTAIAPFFRQISHPNFAVTGGHLKKINNTWYLVGGHKFDGNYNPNNNPTFTQVYTNAIRKFTINDDGVNLVVTHLPQLSDPVNLHRRDYNVLPQIMPDGSEGLTAFSGVFQPTADLPFLNCVNIDSTGYSVQPDFAQYFNHYHCATLPLYSASTGEMHSVFFGGIAQYYENQGNLIQDNNVPFVKTIARVSRTPNGQMTEYKLPIEMPGYLGSGAEFIPIQGVPAYKNEVFKLDSFLTDTTLVGYIVGGINSTAPNIFFTNTGVESSATPEIFKVFVVRSNLTGLHKLNKQSTNGLQLQVYPNPTKGLLRVKFVAEEKSLVRIMVSDSGGKVVKNEILDRPKTGENLVEYRDVKPGTYWITIQTATKKSVQKIVAMP